ncbi:MAG: response regulator, partial [bacterium]|nr:response regulator [bacterium]
LEIDPEARVIVSSGYASGSIMANYTSYGFKGKLPKPFMITDLQSEIESVMSLP